MTTAKRGRPREGSPLTIRLPYDMRLRLAEEAMREGISTAELIRRIIDTHDQVQQ